MKNLKKTTWFFLSLLVLFPIIIYSPCRAHALQLIYNSQAALDEQNETTNNWKLRVTLNCRPVVALHYWFQVYGSIIDPETGQVTDLGEIGGSYVANYPQIYDPATGTYKDDWSGLEFIVSATVPKTYQNTILQLSLSTYNDSCYCTPDEPDITSCYLPSIRDNSCPVQWGNPTNVTTSNKTYRKIDLSIDTPSGKLEFYRTYNSLLGSMGDNRYVRGPLGYNWTYNFNYGLTISGTSPNRKIAFREPDGKIVNFTESSGVFSQTTPGEQFKLTDNGNNTFTLKQEDGSRIQFNSTLDDNTQFIRPEWIEDSKGRRLTFSWASYQWASNVWIEIPSTITDQWGNGFGFDHEVINEKYTGRIQAVYNLKTPSEKVLFTYSTPNGNDYSRIDNLIQATYPNSTQILYYFENPNYKHSLTRIVDENGNATYYEYDAYNRFLSFHQEGTQGYYSFAYDWKTPTQGTWKTTVTDSLNRQTEYQITDSGNERTISITGSGCGGTCSSTKIYKYDKTNGNLLETEDGNNIIIQYANFDAWGNAQTMTEALETSEQRITTSSYNADLNVLLTRIVPGILGAGNKETIYDYDDDGDAIPNEDPTPNLYRLMEKGYTRDLNGNIIQAEYITTYTYNGNGQITSINGPRIDVTDVTTYTYYPDESGQGNNRAMLYQVTNPLSQTTIYGNYDAYGRVGSIIDPNGPVTLYTYDFKGRVTSITLVAAGPSGEDLVTSNFYEANGNLDYIKLPGGGVIDYEYDSADRLTSITRRIGPDDQSQAIDSIQYTYDTEGNKTGETLHEGEIAGATKKSTTFAYDDYNRLWKLIHADSTYQEYEYDGNGNRISAINEKAKETTSLFDALNRLKTVTQPGSITTSYTYDPQDNLTQVTDANNKITTYEYDDFGRMLKVTSPDAGINEYRYDEAGNLIKKIDALGIITNFTYDALNRILTTDLPGTGQDIAYTYDTGTNGIGRLTTIADLSGTLAFQYDKQGNLTQEQKTMEGHAFITQYQYNQNGNLKKIIYPNGREITYTLNQANQITQVDSLMGEATTTLATAIAYYPFGPLAELQLGNNLPASNDYDTDYKLTGLSAGTVLNRGYQYDKTGNVTQISNMGALPVTTAETITYSYQNNNNQLTQAINGSSTSFAYNSAGNLITEVKNGTTRTYTYNYSQRLVSVSEGGITLGQYTYDALGRRTKKVMGVTTTLYIYDQNGLLIAEYDGSGTWQKDYVYLNGQPLTMIVAGTPENVYYYHNDHLGTPQLMTDSTGAVVWSAVYDPFGEATIAPGSTITNNLRFPGQYFDVEMGLHYNWFRYYDPKTGRYVEADPIGLDGGINLFTYAKNNPLIFTDVFGLDCNIEFCVVAPAFMPPYSPNWLRPYVHAFLKIGNSIGSRPESWGFTVGPDDTKATAHVQREPRWRDPRIKCFPVKKVAGGDCECWDCKEVSECVQKNIKKGARNRYKFFFYNCWDWATETVESCCMKVSTPGYINPAHIR